MVKKKKEDEKAVEAQWNAAVEIRSLSWCLQKRRKFVER